MTTSTLRPNARPEITRQQWLESALLCLVLALIGAGWLIAEQKREIRRLAFTAKTATNIVGMQPVKGERHA